MRPVGAAHVADAVAGVDIAATRAGQHVAVRDQRTIFGHAVDVGVRRRNVVHDRNDERAIGVIAVRVGHDHREAVRRVVARGVGRQLIRVGNRTVRETGNGKRTVRAGNRVAHDGNRRAVDGNDSGAIRSRVSDSAAGELAIARSRGAGGRAGQAGFVDFRAGFTGERHPQRGRAVLDGDRQRRGVGAAVPVSQRVSELIAGSPRRVCAAVISVAAVGMQRERTVVAGDDHRPAAGIDARGPMRDRGDDGIVGAHAIGTRRTARRARARNDIAALRAEIRGGNRIRVVGRDGGIVHDIDRERTRGLVAIAIHDRHLEEAVGRLAHKIVVQRVAETNMATGNIDAGDGHRAHRRREGLPDVIDGHAVDQDRLRAVGRVEHDRAAGRFARVAVVRAVAVSGFARAGGFAVARGKTRFVDRRDSVDGADRVVRCFDHHAGFAIHQPGNNLLARLRAELQFRVG